MSETLKPHVLIVDDAALVRLYYREALEDAGFEVEEALNGLEALEKLLARPVDLVIVDVNMPQMDGLTFVATLRRHTAGIASIPVLMSSTEGAAHDIQAAWRAGANGYLVKPISQERLVEYARMLGLPQHG